MKTKKELKNAVKNGEDVLVRETWGQNPIVNGQATIEGPHFPEPHRWYARVQVENGRVVKVK
jgi:hypothetical protein